MKALNLILLLFTVCVLQAQAQKWVDFNKNGQMDMYENPNASVDKRVNDLLSKMTTDEKIGLLREVSPAIPRLGIRKYDHGNESLHGVVRPGKFTVFPQAIGLAATWNPDLIYRISTAISDEARARWNELNQGEDQLSKFSDLLAFWSPTVNMARDPRWGRTPETYGEDPYLTSRIGVSYVKGLQGNDPKYIKVVSTPKHFAGNNEEHNRFECQMTVSEQTLRSYYLPAFKALVTEGNAESIMSAYNAINGVPCTVNKWLLTDVLRKEWGFNGYVVSDCGAPGFVFSDHHYTQSREEAATLAIKAGLDMECGGYCNECFIFTDYLPKALKQGKVTDAEINTAAFRVLRARFKLGIFDSPELNPYTQISPAVIGSEEHAGLALEAARQSIILLKNQNNTLPLNRKKIKSIAVFGINAATCEFGDYSGTPVNDPISPLQGLINKVGPDVKVTHMAWTEEQPTRNAYAKEKQVAKQNDVSIAFLGVNKTIEMEGRDRETLDLPQSQTDFIKAIYEANPKTIVVLIAGSSLTVNWMQDHIPAIVDAWYPGEQGGTAIADVLFGDFNPSGKLPLTFYESMDDLLPFNDYEIAKGRTYMYLNKKPLYPFGHGLSYTTFEYSNIQINSPQVKPGENCVVSVDIKNRGKCSGAEVVQLYLQDVEASVTVPLKQLKRFERIELKAGEQKTLEFVLTREDMSLWNHKNEFVVEPGSFNLMIGSSSDDIRQRASFECN